MNLKDFSPELVLELLERVHPEDFVSVIGSSPVFLRVFNMYPKQVVTAVLKNAMGPDALHHALALAHFRRTEDFDSKTEDPESEDSENEGPETETLQPETTARRQFEFPTQMDSLMEMLYTHIQVSRLTDDYVKKAFKDIAATEKHVDAYRREAKYYWPEDPEDEVESPETKTQPRSRPNTKLSPTERERFHRAFYRFELYCQINPSRRGAEYLEPSLRRKLKEYGLLTGNGSGNGLQFFEMAELTCIHYFFCDLAKTSIRKLNKQFFNAVVSAPNVKACDTSKWGRSDQPGHVMARESNVEPFLRAHSPQNSVPYNRRPDMHNMQMFAGGDSDRKDRLTTHIAMKGLDFMSQLVKADDEMRKTLLRACKPCQRDFTDEMWRFLSPDWQVIWQIQNLELKEDDSRLSGTYGFRLWISRLDLDYSFKRDVWCDPLQILAVPFWDSARVCSPGFRTMLMGARVLERYDLRRLTYEEKSCWAWGESAEIRLARFTVPPNELQRVIDEFVRDRPSDLFV